MKKIFFSLLFFASLSVNAQVGIGVAAADVNVSAQLEVKSTNKGFLPPRMTAAQRDAISSPAAGLVLWCTNCGTTGEIEVFNGVTWTKLVDSVYQASQINSMNNQKLNISDTAAMLSAYSKSNSVVKYSDTSAMLSAYPKSNIVVKYSDTSAMLSPYSKSNIVMKYSDTSAMLSPYSKSNIVVKYSDTSAMLSNYRTGINNAVPYVGATRNLDLGSKNLNVTNIAAASATLSGNITASSISLTGGSSSTVLLGDGSATGSGSSGKVLTFSGTTPTWGNPLPNAVLGVLATDANVQSLSKNLSGGTNPIYTGAYIILPPGKWAVNLVMLSNCNDNNSTITSGTWWIRFGFSTSSTLNIDQGTNSTEFPVNKLVSGQTLANNYGIVQGAIVINNTSASNKTYYLWTANCDLKNCNGTSIINKLAYSGNGENLIYALPMY